RDGVLVPLPAASRNGEADTGGARAETGELIGGPPTEARPGGDGEAAADEPGEDAPDAAAPGDGESGEPGAGDGEAGPTPPAPDVPPPDFAVIDPPSLDAYSLRLVVNRKLYDRGTLVSNSPSLADLAPV